MFFEVLNVMMFLETKGPESRGRENYGDLPRRKPVSSRRDYYVSPRGGGYAAKDR